MLKIVPLSYLVILMFTIVFCDVVKDEINNQVIYSIKSAQDKTLNTHENKNGSNSRTISDARIRNLMSTKDFIFSFLGEYLVNPEYITVTKKINLDGIKEINNALQMLNKQHSEYCKTLHSNIGQTKEKRTLQKQEK